MPGPARLGLCLDKSRRCTVQGHRRLARVQAMCVHSCVSWQAGRPVRPLRPLSALLCSSAAGGRVVSPLPARASPSAGIGSGRPQRGSLPGGRSRIGSRYRRGWVGVGRGGGARPSIFCYYSVMGLLGRPPICHRPRSLITGICHHFPLPMSSALLTAGGGHTHMGLLDTRSCIYTLTHETCGGAMNPVCVCVGGTCISLYVCGPELLRDGYVTACAERASSSRCSQLQIFFRSLGGGGTQVASASSLCGLA